jgi:serine/threonine-protein phosphatase 5
VNMNKMYGFEGEVKAKFDATVMEVFSEVFRALPLAAVVDRKVIVLHGGLFQRGGVTLEDIAKIQRVREPPEDGLMSDILWSDPQPFPGRGPSKRGVGQSFGPDITADFLDANGLQLLIRSHEVMGRGTKSSTTAASLPSFPRPTTVTPWATKAPSCASTATASPHSWHLTPCRTRPSGPWRTRLE